MEPPILPNSRLGDWINWMTAKATTIEVPPAFEQLPERPEREAVPRESTQTPTNSADTPLEPNLDQPANRPGETAEEINTLYKQVKIKKLAHSKRDPPD